MKKDGGPAFPRPIGNNGRPNWEDSDISSEQEGMSLRDWFAGQALASMGKLLPEVWNEHDCGRIAYIIADAMIAERDK